MSLLTTECNAASSCGYHRIALPFSMLECNPRVPVFVFNRAPTCGPYGLGALRMRGIKIVMDIDDYWSLPETHYMHKAYEDSMAGPRTRACLERSDIVMVTNAALADRVSRINPNVVIVPNALPFDEGQFTVGVPGHGFVYAAGPSHYADVASVKEALDSADVTIAGVSSAHPEWHRICALVPNASLTTLRPTDDYMWAYKNHSVALAPLVDTPFNQCKSNLKTLEAGARRMPLIASRNSPYDNPLDRSSIMVADDLSDWRRWMQYCRRYPTQVTEQGQALGEHVRKYYQLRDTNKIRQQIIESFS